MLKDKFLKKGRGRKKHSFHSCQTVEGMFASAPCRHAVISRNAQWRNDKLVLQSCDYQCFGHHAAFRAQTDAVQPQRQIGQLEQLGLLGRSLHLLHGLPPGHAPLRIEKGQYAARFAQALHQNLHLAGGGVWGQAQGQIARSIPDVRGSVIAAP